MRTSSLSRVLLAGITFFLFSIPIACRSQFDPTAVVSGTKGSTAAKSSASRTTSAGRPAAATASRVGGSSSAGPGVPTVRHQLMDQAWGLPWGTISLPQGWGFNGGVIHAGTKGCAASGDSPMWVGESQDKLSGIAILPTLKTNWTGDQNMSAMMQRDGCPTLHSMSAKDYITEYVLPHIQQKSATVVDIGPEPQLAQLTEQLRQQNAQFDQINAGGPYSRTRRTVDSARVLLTYEEGGRQVNEVASTVLGCTDTVMSMPALRRQMETVECLAPVTFIVHMPSDGTPFTRAAIEAQEANPKPTFFKIEQNPAWNQRFLQEAQLTSQRIQQEGQQQMQANQQMFQSNLDAAKQRSAAISDVSDYRRKVMNNVYENRQAANSQVNGAYAAHMGDYNVYTNPNTGQQAQLSNQYTNTYVNQNGNTALQTNSANAPGPNWTLMVPKY